MQAEFISQGAMVAVKTPYNTSLIDEIKLLPGRRWDAANKCWLVPVAEEGNAREIVRKYYQIKGEGSIVQMETKRLRIVVEASARRTYVGRVEIDGQELVWSNSGSLRMEGPEGAWKVLEATGGYISGDARHAYKAEYTLTLSLRKGAKIETSGRNTAIVEEL